MEIQAMKIHQFARAFWEHDPSSPSTLSLGCKRLRPLAPKLPATAAAAPDSTFDLKSFIRPESGRRTICSSDFPKKESAPQQVEAPGATRWNPTQEQIGILEMMYRGGMRTPNAHQIEQITAQLALYGKIEGKNVFYWFQNHKARERQKQKRHSLAHAHAQYYSTRSTPPPPPSLFTCSIGSTKLFSTASNNEVAREIRSNDVSSEQCKLNETNGLILKGDDEDQSDCMTSKKKCMAWNDDSQSESKEEEEEEEGRTLELFPLHPEARSIVKK